MSARAANCPSCGGEVLFRAGTSLVTVCTHCRAAVARKGVSYESIGQVAELVATSSPFTVGMSARPKVPGIRPFTIAGRLQLSYGKGTWDEWYVAFDDGKYGWLAEAQGQFWLTRALPPPSAPPPPEFSHLAPGMRLQLNPYGLFTVTDRRQALYVSAEGDLPFASPPGSVFMYADISGADGSVGTLDYGDDPGVDAFFVGQQVELAALGIDGLVAWGARTVSAKASSLNCPNCGGGIELKDPQGVVRIACPYCGSILGSEEGGAASGKYAVLDALREAPFRPPVPLGAEGNLLGLSYVVLGCVLKSTESDGTTYFWRETLLKEKKSEAYHWLAESNGHWTLLAPVAAGQVTEVGKRAGFGGRTYKRFNHGQAKVEAVLGEFYWEVARGETTVTADYVAPPRMLSSEATGEEVAWTEGTYLDRTWVEQGFSLKEPLPAPEGIGANQPWPKEEEARRVRKACGALLLALAVLFVFFQIKAARQQVFQKRFDLTWLSAQLQGRPAPPMADLSDFAPAEPGTPAGKADERVFLSEPFEISRSGNLEARISAPTNNSWVGLGADLIAVGTGEVRSFYLLSDYYHGVDGGESWSEGSAGRSVFVSQVPAGKYVLRLDPESESGKTPAWVEVKLVSGVPRIWRYVVAALLLLLGPLWGFFSRASFEARRWADSDEGGASGGSSSSDDSSSDSSDSSSDE